MMEYERINLDDYVQTGEGGTAVSYTHKNGDALIKLYNMGFEADRAIEEFKTARMVYDMGISTPKPIRLITDGERYGAEYELIKNKRSFARILSEEPERLEEITLTFARLAKDINSIKADKDKVRSFKQRIARFYQEKDRVPQAYKEQALAFIEKVPDHEYCLHGDLQIGNIISDGKRTLWIDLGEFSYGLPQWDLSMLWTMCNRMREEMCERLFHVKHEVLQAHWNIFLPAYLGTTDKQKLEEYVRGLFPFYAVKVPYMYDIAMHAPIPTVVLDNIIGFLK